ncbi:MAG TPA: 4-carboxy-4-hydroxy-2-oxoadipate aldolase/oxaloacetate decarboxylase, partial [Burkholderiaceae bacterium]|nr:4-carboxy-4-hydroxy-2-oxoadipate aldolase/oxaloacetate decarboxylase [Burkholderiaceae bacterium]
VFSCGSYAQDQRGRVRVIAYRKPLEIGGVLVEPGDILAGDVDGVVCVPRDLAARTLEAAAKREANEGTKRDQLAAGVLGLDMYKMREPLAAAGLRYID